METATIGTFLMHKPSGESTYSVLNQIKDYPDLGGAPELLETTDLSDTKQRFIFGVQSGEAMPFTCNFTPSGYSAIKALERQLLDLSIWFGGTVGSDGKVTPTGDDLKLDFKGYVSVYISGKGVNEVREMIITVAANTDFSITIS